MMMNLIKAFSLYFIFGLLVFSNSFNNKFLIDDFVFLSNPVLSETKYVFAQWNPYKEQSLGNTDDQIKVGGYRPLQNMVMDLCYATFKDNYRLYHLLNLFLFVFASSLIFLLIEKVTGNYRLAFLTGLFYLIHPINGIIVNYISASVFAFQVICILASVLLLLMSLEKNNAPALYLLSLFFSFLSLFWHELGVMSPFYISSVVFIFRKDPFKVKVLYLFPYFLIMFLYFVIRFFFLNVDAVSLGQILPSHASVWIYPATLFQAFAWYFSKLLFPQGIVMAWAMPLLHEHIAVNVIGLFFLILIFILLFIRLFNFKICQLGLVWFFIGFIPVSLAAFKILGNSVQIEPHWFVFSSIGFFMLVSFFCLLVLDLMKTFGLVLLIIMILTLSSFSYAYDQLWADQKTYALYWSQQVPYLRSPYSYLADAYKDEGAFTKARKYYKMALTGRFPDAVIYNELGLIDQTEGHLKEAETNYVKALKIYPNSAATFDNLGSIYLALGQFDKAKAYFDRSLICDHLVVEPRLGLALIHLKRFEYQEAMDLCFKNLEIVKNDPRTLLLLIDISIQKKDILPLSDFVHRYISVSSDPVALTKLGVYLAKYNALQLAMDCFARSMRVSANYKDAYLAVGVVFANIGKYNEAIHIWKIGSGIDPTDERFDKNITQASVLMKGR